MQSFWKRAVGHSLNMLLRADPNHIRISPANREQIADFIDVARGKTTQMLGRRLEHMSRENQHLVCWAAINQLGESQGVAFEKELRRQAVL